MNNEVNLSATAQAYLDIFEELSGKPIEERSQKLGDMLAEREAFWMHSGDPNAPHAELTTGKCSDGFIDTLRALKDSVCCFASAYGLARVIRQTYTGPIDWVIGSDHAGAVFSQNVALHLGADHDFTEKGPEKTQLWKRFKIDESRVVIQVEELMTTASTFQAVRKGVREGNGDPVLFAPVAGVLVHRSSVEQIEDTRVIAFAHYDITVWEPAQCPLCAKGSKRLRPKTNWKELTGKV